MININFTPFPVLQTERLTLRQLIASDDIAISLLRSDEEVNRFIDRPKQKTTRAAREFILLRNEEIKQNKSIYWSICLKENPTLIGTICLWNFSDDESIAEIGYELSPPYQRQGLMNEAFRCVLEYCFDTIGLDTVEAVAHKDNIKSARLLEKNKFIFDKKRKDDKNINNYIFTLSKT